MSAIRSFTLLLWFIASIAVMWYGYEKRDYLVLAIWILCYFVYLCWKSADDQL